MERFRMDYDAVQGVLRKLRVRNYVELAVLHAQKIGYPLCSETIKSQLSKDGRLSMPNSRALQSLCIICDLEAVHGGA